jgi:hypothetical protein
LAFVFSNLKIVWICLQISIVASLSVNIEATGVDPSFLWYWGQYIPYANDDDYANSFTITNNNNKNNKNFQMTCNNVNCTQVCPGDCHSPYFFGNTVVEVGAIGLNVSTCQVTFRYLQTIFVLIVFALSWDALIQVFIAMHMIYHYFYPDSNWWFTTNLHCRTIFIGILYLLRPSKAVQWLINPAKTLYPPLPDVMPTPYAYILVFTILVDFPFSIASTMWAFYSGGGLGVYLAIASLGNMTLNFLGTYYLQFLEDIQVLVEDENDSEVQREKNRDISLQLLPIR